MLRPSNPLPETIRAQSVDLLNTHLAAAIDLLAQVRQAQWTVRRPGFSSLHHVLDKVRIEIENYSSVIAGQAGELGDSTPRTIRAVMPRSFLAHFPRQGRADGYKHAFAVYGSLVAFGQSSRDAAVQATMFGDADTADLFSEIAGRVDRQLGIVEAHIATRGVASAIPWRRLRPDQAPPNNATDP